MTAPLSDDAVFEVEPVAEELITAVLERDPDMVAAVFAFADAKVLAVILAELVGLERERTGKAHARRVNEVRDAREQGSAAREENAELRTAVWDRDMKIRELNERVWGTSGGVAPAGISLERAEQIAAQSAERRNA